MKPFLLSLYDYTGTWSQPYVDAGWKVMRWDKQIDGCVLERFSWIESMIEEETGGNIQGLLAAPPCTAFTSSGAVFWPQKDQPTEEYFPFDSFTEYMVGLTLIVLHAVDVFQPDFWALENPVGRIEKLIPELRQYRRMMFDPCDFGDPYTKKTILWGEFNANLKTNPVEPEYIIASNGNRYSKMFWYHKSKNIRSKTPEGFARAFYQANNESLQFRKQMKLAI